MADKFGAGSLSAMPDEVLQKIISFVSVSPLDLKLLKGTCRQWNQVIKSGGFDLRMLLVTEEETNKVAVVSVAPGQEVIQRFSANPPPRKRKRDCHTVRYRGRGNRPSYMALGPKGRLFVTQLSVPCVVEFKGSHRGYQYGRMRQTQGGRNSIPEGLVVAHDSLYLLLLNGRVTRSEIGSGKQLESAGPKQEHKGELLWGMCITPDKKTLLIAGHWHDNQDLSRPTRESNGVIFRLDLAEDGSFKKARGSNTPIGYYKQKLPTGLQLNRPCHPQFCSHDVLHVSTFFGQEGKRRIHKLSFDGSNQVPTHYGWLEQGEEQQHRLDPCRICFSERSEEVFITFVSSMKVAKLATCGCNQVLGQGSSGLPRAISLGQATILGGGKPFDVPSHILAVE